MASTVQQVEVVPNSTPPADLVGRAFVHQYYLILHKSPELVHRFYQEHSILSRADVNGIMSTTTTMQAINDKVLSYDYGSQSAEITTVDSQDSYNGGVLVLVTGHLTGADNSRQKFTQSFFLAPQETGFYVYNDVFRHVVEGGNPNESQALASDPEGHLTSEQDSPTLQNQVSETEVEMSDDVGPDEKVDAEVEVCNTNTKDKEVAVEEEKTPVPVVVAETPKDSTPVKPISKIEEAPKKSYASILSTHHHVKDVKESVAPLPAPTRAPFQKNQEPMSAAPTPISETVVSGPNVNENGKFQEVEDGFSVYIRGLPLNTTPTLVESEFKKFGPIKVDGIQVKFNKGLGFGFVKFEEASAAQGAIEASPIKINGRNIFIEEKRSTYRGGGYRGRFSGPRGLGSRDEGIRGCGGGYGGGRGYGRGGDFENRNGGRGGGAAYPRDDNGGGRENRDGLLGAAENAVKSTSIQVSASA